MTKEQQQWLEFLLLQYIDGKASPEEERKLFAILESKDLDRARVEELIEELAVAEPGLAQYKAEDWQKVLENCLRGPVEDRKVKVETKAFWIRWTAAAAVIILVALGGIWLLRPSKRSVEPVSKVVPVQDVSSPVISTAVLTLSNGKKVFLNRAPDGLVTTDGGINLVKSPDGEWIYEVQGAPATAQPLSYNTIDNPRGSPVVNISLSDGSKVWLNTGSSITYPTLFTAEERIVEVTGEAYFEVKHNENKPFIVKGKNMQVQVLGTHFNINNYPDEPSHVTTLLEGSVKIMKDHQAVVLKPGQQASVTIGPAPGNAEIAVIDDADLKSVMAWKDGLFDFNNAHITGIMRQLARWYNVDVLFSGKIPERHYTGAIRKSVNLSEVIRMIELAGGVKVTIDNKRMIVQEK